MSLQAAKTPDVTALIVGAGWSGMYLIYRLRKMGHSLRCFEAAPDVGGTWYWNRYPGARCDVESIDYSFSFDPELEQEWEWTERYATQPEILRYANHVADKYRLRSHISFDTRVVSAHWDQDSQLWTVTTDRGERVTARHFIMATGCLSQPKDVDIEGVENFRGEIYRTHRWPHQDLEFSGKSVGVIGTGSSGIQCIPLLAAQAAQLTVFQRTANFSFPARNGPIPQASLANKARYPQYREEARWSQAGICVEKNLELAVLTADNERRRRYEQAWEGGGIPRFLQAYADIAVSEDANETLASFVREKIHEIVDDPNTAQALAPKDHPVGTKRPCLDTDYFATFNRPNVTLVNLRQTPITRITETGIATSEKEHALDVIVLATGFDAMTGALMAVDIRGAHGLTLKDKWADGPLSYIGLTVAGFPNFYTITGPGSPSVLSNMMVSIEQHVEWVTDCIDKMSREGHTAIEATEQAEAGWVKYALDTADLTLFPRAKSWYTGANVPGKPRVCMPYLGGVGAYRRVCNDIVANDYLGFRFTGPDGIRENDGLVRRQQPDVVALLELLEEMALPALNTLSPLEAREMAATMAAGNPPGPAVGHVGDGVYPGAAGELDYRLYSPDTEGPHPITLYFHGGGWMIGDHASDDAFCRDLCVRSGTVVISCNYRHAPEARFPAAVDDGYAALQWVADNAERLGGIPGELAVCGWSAGGNIAAVACQIARDRGGPQVSAQILITPVTDGHDNSASMTENAEGFILTSTMMNWLWEHYADEAERAHPKASPVKGNLAGLPPALVLVAEFDPLRDQGIAYAKALKAAGNEARYIHCDGHIHTSVTAVGAVMTATGLRQQIADELKRRRKLPEAA